MRPKFIGSLMFPTVIVLLLALFAVRDTASVLAHGGPDLTPATVEASLPPGGSTQVEKTVHTPVIPPLPDIVFLADTTGSMGPAVANVQANIGTIMSTVLLSAPTAQFGAGNYKDGDPAFCPSDLFAFNLDQSITASTAAVNTAVGTWAVDGHGCDTPESWLYALDQLATSGAVGFRAGSTRIIVMFGDSTSHDPALGVTQAQAIADLTGGANSPIRVIAVPVASGFGDGLDATGQATVIVAATGGVLLPAATPDQVATAILAGLTNLPVTVAMATNCVGDVTAAFVPVSQVVTSGTHAVFTETITLSATAPQGTTLTCEDWATLDGTPMTDGLGVIILERKTIHVLDVTPPVARCLETTNPSGKNVPKAGDNPKSGQNPDGFYELVATDNVDPNPQIFLVDSVSGEVFGPFASGTKIKLVQAPGATPNQKPGPGDIDWHITINGDAIIYAVDASGNASARVTCLVPPPPK